MNFDPWSGPCILLFKIRNKLVWRDVASCVLALVNGLGQGQTLFLMNPRLLKLTILPPFYQGLFKSWALFKTCVSPKTSLHWLLKEPLVCGARLDIQSSATPGLAATLTRRGTLELRQLVEAAGPALDNVDAVRGLLGVTSSRHVAGRLNLWTQRLTVTECRLLREYCSGSLVPDQGDRPSRTSPWFLSWRTAQVHCWGQTRRARHYRMATGRPCTRGVCRQFTGTSWEAGLTLCGGSG